jgi:hypothetical protein
MKKLISIVLVCSLMSAGCASSKVINGTNVSPYGWFNPSKKQENVKYKTSTGSALLGFVLIPAGLLGPIYFWGFHLYEPVEAK